MSKRPKCPAHKDIQTAFTKSDDEPTSFTPVGMEVHTRTVEQRLRWWRGIACGVVMLSLLSLALPSGKAADTQPRGMAERMSMVEKKLAAMDFNDAVNEVVITGADQRVVNGLGSTVTTIGLGNLIVGYNELRRRIRRLLWVNGPFLRLSRHFDEVGTSSPSALH